MAASDPHIQVLSKKNYEDQHIVALPNALPLPPLRPSALRVKPVILSLSTNNFTYARIGHLLGWWDVHPLPPSIPSEFADPNEFGRISAWGYGVVTESTLPKGSGIEVGTRVYGYLPIGTLPVDMKVEVNKEIPGQFYEISPHRAKLMPIYNRYLCYPPINGTQYTAEQKQSEGYNSLCQVLFETGYMMNRFVFAYEPSERVHPSQEIGELRADPRAVWSAEEAHIGKDTIVLLFAASGKTALGFAHQLKNGRPKDKVPRNVVAVGSDASQAFTEGTGLYDFVLNYNEDANSDLATKLGVDAETKVIIADFGARGGAADRWADKLKGSPKTLQIFSVGGEVVAVSPEVMMQKFVQIMQTERIQINASGMRSQALEKIGGKRYFEEVLKEWNKWKDEGGVKGLKLVWGEGMDDVGKGWEKLYKGEVGPDEGLVFEL